jgi:heme oxygenase
MPVEHHVTSESSAISVATLAATPSAMQQLKDATATQHKELEAHFDLAQIGASQRAYQQLLRRYYGFYAPLERHLSALPWGEAGFDFTPRVKCTLLTHDLQYLGDGAATIAALPQCAELPPLPSLAHGFGCLYVLEGATLGGQLILRALQQRLPINATAGATFFASYGNARGSMWQRFGAAVNAYAVAQPTAMMAMIASARTTFAGFARWLARG